MNRSSLLPHLFKEELYYFPTPVILVLARPWESYSTADHTMLQRLLAAVRKLDPTPIRVFVRAALDLEALRALSPEKVVVFGAAVAQDVPLYETTATSGVQVLRADDLNALDEEKKKILWAGLKQMFTVQ